jgi:hypothetical protein
MGITVSRSSARARFERALDLAVSDRALPDEWTQWARKIAFAPSMTFTPMLGTALLAKATDGRIDARALSKKSGFAGHSARGLCKDVLVPLCWDAKVNLRTRKREPLNNSPFYRQDYVSLSINAGPKELSDLIEALDQVNELDADEALLALAAFLRQRIVEDPDVVKTMGEFAAEGDAWPFDRVAEFVHSHSDGGRVGQAFVGAALGVLHEGVVVGSANDPSRRWPGDVHVGGAPPAIAVEVRQKAVDETDVDMFRTECAEKGIRTAIVAAFAPGQRVLRSDELSKLAQEQHGQILEVVTDVAQFARRCAVDAAMIPVDSWTRFAKSMLENLQTLQASQATVDAWLALVVPEEPI